MLEALYGELASSQGYQRPQPIYILPSISPLPVPKMRKNLPTETAMPQLNPESVLLRGQMYLHMDSIWVQMSQDKRRAPKEVSPFVHKHLHPTAPLPIKN